jgi:transposase-like protein
MKLTAFLKRFGTNEACRAHLESVRWPDGPICPHCGVIGDAWPVGGRPGLYLCQACGKQFSVTVGTPMHGSHLPLSVWYLAMYLILASSKGISSVKLGEHLGVGQKTAWFLGHRLRAMLDAGEKLPLSGIVEADESYIGGKARNRRKGAPAPGRGRGTRKPMLFAAIERGGDARTAVIGSATIEAIAPLIWNWTGGNGGAVLMSDELATYRWIGRKMEAHHVVNHARREFARTTTSGLRAHVNTAEGFFGLFKRALVGVWHQISVKHLHRYAAEHEFRWNRRRIDVADRIARCLIGQHGRLRWKELVA